MPEDMATFRNRAREWLARNAEPRAPGVAMQVAAHDGAALARADDEGRRWQGMLHEAGFAGLDWPLEYGGRGMSKRAAAVFLEEERGFAVSRQVMTIALNMASRVLMAHGSDDQKHHHLPRILDGRSVWCQMFSEPEAGSDLFSLKTKAVLDGDRFRVNGRKIWISMADRADYGMLLARSDPGQSRHKGLSFIIVPMGLPGITVRPIQQATGAPEFCEVFLDDVLVPAENLIGSLHGGAQIAFTLLKAEREMLGAGMALNDRPGLGELIETARRRGTLNDAPVRRQLGRACVRERMLQALWGQNADALLDGTASDSLAVLLKLLSADHLAKTVQAGMELSGPAPDLAEGDDCGPYWQYHYLHAWAERFGGGTEQIQKNTLAQQALNLPRPPRAV